MRKYNPKTGKYTLPRSTYYRIVYFVKDYPRLCELADSIIEATPTPTETPEIQRQRNLKATETMALRYAEVLKDIRDVDDSLKESVPLEYRQPILASIINDEKFPLDNDRRTYSKYKQRFIYRIAEKRHLV